MITPELKERLSKVYEMVKRGTDGERAAAQNLLDRLLSKHNIEGIDLESLDKTNYYFKYSTQMDLSLLTRIVLFFLEDESIIKSAVRQTGAVRQIKLNLKYLDYITVSCAYEYYRRHMRVQWNKYCAEQVKKCKKAKTRNAKRDQLQTIFFSSYIIASNLCKPENITTCDPEKMSKSELEARTKLLDVEGGQYKTQLHTGLLLN